MVVLQQVILLGVVSVISSVFRFWIFQYYFQDINRRSWKEAGKTDDLKLDVLKLIEGNEYLLRVSAENKYGVSEPAQIEEPILAKNPYSELIIRMNETIIKSFPLR